MRRAMVRYITMSIVLGAFPFLQRCRGEETPPTTYELMINGEAFIVELDQQTKLKSVEHPNVGYDIALRLAPRQRMALTSLQFEYAMPATVVDDRNQGSRTVRIRHDLGYTILLTELPSLLKPGAEQGVYALLKASVTKSLGEAGMTLGAAEEPKSYTFAGCKAYGGRIHYADSQAIKQACMVYVLRGEKFAATCVIQYYEEDSQTAMRQIKATLDSIAPTRTGPN